MFRSRSSAPCRMYPAAILSTTSPRRLREASASSSVRVTAAVENRSSHIRMGSCERAEKLRAKARADCADGPSDPSMLSGRPTTSPPTCWAKMIASSFSASVSNLLRFNVSRGVATDSEVSESASPIVFSPRSSPRRRAFVPTADLKAAMSRIVTLRSPLPDFDTIAGRIAHEEARQTLRHALLLDGHTLGDDERFCLGQIGGQKADMPFAPRTRFRVNPDMHL